MTKKERELFYLDMSIKTKIPKDLYSSIENKFPKYLIRFDKKKNTNCQCQACGKTVFVENIKVNSKSKCPNCRKSLVVKTLIKGIIRDSVDVAYAYKHNKDICVDYATVKRELFLKDNEIKSNTELDLFAFMVYNEKDGERNYEFKSCGSYKQWYRIDTYNYYTIGLHRSVRRYYKDLPKGNIMLSKRLFERNNPAVEYLTKKGLTNLAYTKYAKEKGNSLAEVLKINPNMIPKIAKFNINQEIYETIKYFKINCSEKDLERLIKNYSYKVTRKALRLMSLTKYLNYFEKMYTKYYPQHMKYQVDTWYDDYLRMCKEANVDIKSHKSKYAPVNLKEEHDRLIEVNNQLMITRQIEFREKEAEAARMLDEKAYDLYGDWKPYIGEKYGLIIPTAYNQLVTEGQSLNHCVGTGSTYMRRHANGESLIAFIRKVSRMDKPFVTMELDLKSMTIRQLYGFGDSTPDKEVKEFALEFVEELKGNKKLLVA